MNFSYIYAMLDTLAIANYFVRKSFDTGVELTPMKLIKLCYIAHGWHLGIYGKPLANEPVLAWPYGPVLANVYHAFKDFRDSQITGYAEGFNGTPYPSEENEEILQFLDKIWAVYKNYNGLQLSTMTHQKDTPWDIVYHQHQGYNLRNLIIPDSLIMAHYKQLMNPSTVQHEPAGATA